MLIAELSDLPSCMSDAHRTLDCGNRDLKRSTFARGEFTECSRKRLDPPATPIVEQSRPEPRGLNQLHARIRVRNA